MKTLTRIFLALASVTAPLVAADTVELKQRWDAGKQYFYTAQTSQQSSITIGPQKMDQTVKMTMEMDVAVRPHEDGKRKRLIIRYDRMAMDMSMNDQKLGYDSAKPDEGTDPLGFGKTLGAMIGKELKILTDEKDVVSEVENYDEYIKQLTAGGGPAGMDITKMFTREGLLETMKQGSLQAFPGHPVTAGDSWPFSNHITLPQVGTVTVKGTYTFKGMVDHGGAQCAEIMTDGTITMEAAAGGAEAGAAGGLAALGVKVTDGSIKGPVWFDPKLGTARDADLMQEMTISMKNPVGPGGRESHCAAKAIGQDHADQSRGLEMIICP